MSKELWKLTAVELSALIRSKETSVTEVIEAHLARIKAVNPSVNALPEVLSERALAEAHAADARRGPTDSTEPLFGIPISVKMGIDLAGSVTSYGVTAWKDNSATQDAPITAHLRSAGALPIGRGNMPDFGLFWKTINELHGETLNPWDPARTAGGSSGGDAVAVATGMVSIGIGGDMGGSLRVPAQCCGIAALRPSLGRVSRVSSLSDTSPPQFYSQVAEVLGPMARSVADLRLALEVMQRPGYEDPVWMKAPIYESPEPCRVALCLDPGAAGLDQEVETGIRQAADILENAGYSVVETTIPFAGETTQVIDTICAAEIGRFRESIERDISEEARIVFRNGLIPDCEPDLSAYADAIAERYRIGQAWGAFLEEYPLVLGPVSTFDPFEKDFLLKPGNVEKYLRSIALTEVGNLLGLPCLAIPVSAGRLPRSAQLIAARFREDRCFSAGETIEKAVGSMIPIDPVQMRSRPG